MTKVKKTEIRVRIAPSPTGLLHIGTARAALFNWLFARHHTGKFILRIEDTDRERSKKEFENDIITSLDWLGLKWDELYRQSDRAKIYSKYIQKILDSGKAFWCHHSEEELKAERQAQLKGKDLPRHVCSYRHSQQPSASRQQGVIRLAVDENSGRKIAFDDLIKGHIEFEEKLLGDFSIAKDVDHALFNFANVIDDHVMNISHVIRGEDHIANVPRQILIQEALGFPSPKFGHLPLILGSDRSKLSKRHGSESVAEYRQLGYLPDAVVNFLVLLGWTPEKTSREILTKNEMIEEFSLERVHQSGAVFDIKKLNWLNSEYIKTYNDQSLYELVKPFLKNHFGEQDEKLVVKILPLFRERLEYLDQAKEFHYFFKQPSYDPALLIWKKSDLTGAKRALELVKDLLKNWSENDAFDKIMLRDSLDKLAQADFAGDRGGVYWPLRVALSGENFSPDPVEIATIIGLEETSKRIANAVELI